MTRTGLQEPFYQHGLHLTPVEDCDVEVCECKSNSISTSVMDVITYPRKDWS